MDEYLQALEEELKALVESPNPSYDAFYGMFRYHLGWVDDHFAETPVPSGKRLRPLLCLLCCEANGGDWRIALPIAAAIELTHNFSLIHDDIEDKSNERHGRSTVWRVWGLAQGLNAGDGMFVLARLALDRLCQRGIPVTTCTDVSLIFDAATLELCHGQFLDLGFEERLDVTIDEYLPMVCGKTAALISASTRIGSMLASSDWRVVDAFAEFGENIGVAFQLTDDILGIWGDPKVTGKSAATDILSRKKSLPAIYGLQRSPEMREIYQQPIVSDVEVQQVLDLLASTGAREYTQQKADEYRARALEALAETKLENSTIERLREIAGLMTRRNK